MLGKPWNQKIFQILDLETDNLFKLLDPETEKVSHIQGPEPVLEYSFIWALLYIDLIILIFMDIVKHCPEKAPW